MPPSPAVITKTSRGCASTGFLRQNLQSHLGPLDGSIFRASLALSPGSSAEVRPRHEPIFVLREHHLSLHRQTTCLRRASTIPKCRRILPVTKREQRSRARLPRRDPRVFDACRRRSINVDGLATIRRSVFRAPRSSQAHPRLRLDKKRTRSSTSPYRNLIEARHRTNLALPIMPWVRT